MQRQFLKIVLTCLTATSFLSAKEEATLAVAAKAPPCFVEQEDTFSAPFVNVIKACSPAVVHILGEVDNSQMYQRRQDRGHQNPYEQFQDELFERFFGTPNPQQRPQGSMGSGFFVSPDGFIITNYHVVAQATQISITREGEEIQTPAELVGFDQKSDIAVLKIDTKGETVPYLTFADSDHVEAGQWVIAIGSPFGLRHTATAGLVSAMHRSNLQISQIDDFIQVDAAINPGNSGGPLLNLRGEVIGMNTAIYSQSGGNIGLGFAVPSNMIKFVSNNIVETGVVNRGFIGIQLQELTPELASGFQLPRKTQGVVIAEVIKDGPGDQAGLMAGDVIISVDKKPVASPSALIAVVARHSVGEKITLEIYRNGQKKRIDVVLGSQAGSPDANNSYLQKYGFEVELLTPEKAHQYGMRIEDTGMVITKVNPGTKAAKAGFRAGQVIVVINGRKIKSYDDLQEALKHPQNGKHVFLTSHKGRASFHCIED